MRLRVCWPRILSVAAILLTVTGGLKPAAPPAEAETTPHLGYGVNLRYLSNLDSILPPLGFGWVKLYERFGTMPTERLPYDVLYRIDIGHGDRWSGHPYRPDLEKIRQDVHQMALDGLGLVEAYEIGNEPNMEWEWQGQPPDPADYVAVLQVAHETIKAVDPDAIIVSAGLGPVGRIEGQCTANSGETYARNNCAAMDEREYAREMFRRGAGDYFDAFGYHPVGFAYPPEQALDELPAHDNGNGFTFRGAEVMHAIMEEHGLGHKPIWATEFGWLRDPAEDGFGWCHGEDTFASYEWYDLPEAQQADYLTRAFQYADENWPWMGAMFIWAFDFHHEGADCWHGRYFSIRKYDGTEEGAPTMAYSALVTMTKRPGHFGPVLMVEPGSLSFSAEVDAPGVLTDTLTPLNVGYGMLTWTAAATGMAVTPTLALTTGLQGMPLTVTVDTTGLASGLFTGTITVTSAMTDVLGVPQIVPVTLSVSGPPAPRLAIIPTSLFWLADIDEPTIVTATLHPLNTGGGVLTWTAAVGAGMSVTPSLVMTTGLQGTPLTLTVDGSGYATGTFTGSIRVSATATDVLDSPLIVPLTLQVVPEIYAAYLPVALRTLPSS